MAENVETNIKDVSRHYISEQITPTGNPVNYIGWVLCPSRSDPYADDPYPHDLPLSINTTVRRRSSGSATIARVANSEEKITQRSKSAGSSEMKNSKDPAVTEEEEEEEKLLNSCPHSRFSPCSLCKLYRMHSGVDIQNVQISSMGTIPEDPSEGHLSLNLPEKTTRQNSAPNV